MEDLDERSRPVTPDNRSARLVQRLLEHYPAFQAFLQRRLHDDALANDLLQQSFVRAIQHHHTVQNDESVVPWFYRILRHAMVDYYRTHAAETRRDELFLHELTTREEDKFPPPDEVKAAVCACLYDVLPKLRSNYADLVRRVDLESQPPSQVAEELQITPNNLTVRLHRARQALRTSLEEACGICSKHGCLNCTCQ
jgi:RNA polymerase sigma factor (sigma-70 family)